MSDAVTTLASGVDGAVRRLETAYDTAGRPFLFSSYDAASGGNVVNQVQRVFNGLSQLTTEYQAVSGAVNTSTTPKVQYAYSEMTGGANHSRQTSLTYPNGRVVNYTYASGVDNTISRLTSMTDSGVTLESHAKGDATRFPLTADSRLPKLPECHGPLVAFPRVSSIRCSIARWHGYRCLKKTATTKRLSVYWVRPCANTPRGCWPTA